MIVDGTIAGMESTPPSTETALPRSVRLFAPWTWFPGKSRWRCWTIIVLLGVAIYSLSPIITVPLLRAKLSARKPFVVKTSTPMFMPVMVLPAPTLTVEVRCPLGTWCCCRWRRWSRELARGEIGFAHATIHSFRHFFVSEASRQRATEAEIMAWVGHRASEMIRHDRHLRRKQSVKFLSDDMESHGNQSEPEMPRKSQAG